MNLVPPTPADDPPGTTYGPLRRDTTGVHLCACGHLATEHRHDLAKTQPCHRGGCGCQYVRPTATLFRESRTVWVPVEG